MTPIAVNLSDIIQEPNKKSLMTQWRIEGMVSTTGLAKERGVRQCQYFAINQRPVDLPKLSSALNECWQAFCSDRMPSCVIQLVLLNFAYDINLLPDKRMVVLMHETEICQVLQKALTDLWSNQMDGKFQVNELEHSEKHKCHQVHVGTSVQDGIMPSNISTTVMPSPSQYLNHIGFHLRVTGAENSSNKTVDEHDKL